MTTFQHLFAPLQIGNVTVDNRIVVMPHTTLLSTDHLIGDRHVAYYEERAKGGAGLVIVETLIVHASSQPLMNEAFAFDEREVPRYRELTAAVHRHGTKIFAQIAHGGRQLIDGGGTLTLEHGDWDLFRETVTRVVENGVQGAGRVLDARRSLMVLAALDGTSEA